MEGFILNSKINVVPASVPAIIVSILRVVFVIIGTIIGAGFASRSRDIFVF